MNELYMSMDYISFNLIKISLAFLPIFLIDPQNIISLSMCLHMLLLRYEFYVYISFRLIILCLMSTYQCVDVSCNSFLSIDRFATIIIFVIANSCDSS